MPGCVAPAGGTRHPTGMRTTTNRPPRVAVHDMAAAEWVPSGPRGIWQQNIRSDPANGRWFGGVRFEPLSRSGVHRHLGPAASYMLSGSLVDHVTRMSTGQALINLTGAVHDVICYDAALVVARVDGPVLYPRDSEGVLNELGFAAEKAGEAVDETVGQPSDVCIDVGALTPVPGPVPGVTRRALFDYAGQAWRARYVELVLAPGTRVPAHVATGLTDLFVLAGEIRAGDEAVGSGCYVTVEAEAELTLSSRYGARLLAWADGPTRWCDGVERGDLYGY
jgi:quercetin dioxygenase-like cupin family protein